MLPFLKPKQASVAGLIIKNRTPDKTSDSSEQEADKSMESMAKDIISAIQSQDHAALASSLKSIFQKFDSEPHVEGEHTNSFDAQNIKAAKE